MTGDDERVTVTTYVPAYQREEWGKDAEGMGMSRSEFVRTMVQAGRRGFDFERDDGNAPEPPEEAVDPRGDGLESRIVDLLEQEGHLEWDELLAGVTDDVEDRLDEALSALQERGRVLHSGRHGGYTLVEGGHGE